MPRPLLLLGHYSIERKVAVTDRPSHRKLNTAESRSMVATGIFSATARGTVECGQRRNREKEGSESGTMSHNGPLLSRAEWIAPIARDLIWLGKDFHERDVDRGQSITANYKTERLSAVRAGGEQTSE